MTALAVGFDALAGPWTALAVVPPWFAGPSEVALVAKAGAASTMAAATANAAHAPRIV